MTDASLTLRSITDDDMTAEKALKIGRMIGRSCDVVCVGSDTNPSSSMIRNSLISGLLSTGTDVNDAGIAPAPAVALASAGSDCILMVGEPNELGHISRIYIMNSDGSVFTKEQLREMILTGQKETPLPGYKDLGTLRSLDSVAEEYSVTICSKHGKGMDTPVMLDCGCGCTSICAPQILASLGADLTTINAQNDPQYSPRPQGVSVNDISGLMSVMDTGHGSIGIALNGDGTRLALVDEKGRYVDPENILSLLLLYLRPSRLVVPFNASAVVDDAFWGLIGEGVHTTAKAGAVRKIIRTANDIESITAAIKDNGADMGALTDGTFIFPSITFCPDAINAAVILAKMSKENSLSNLISSFPQYVALKEKIYYPVNTEAFNKKLNEKLRELDAKDVWGMGGWRVSMKEGWFSISRNADNPDYVIVTAEAKDKVYAISMMELAKGFIRDSM